MLSTRPAPVASPQIESGSLLSTLAFGALLGLLLLAPFSLSGFWATTYDFWPQASWLLLSAGVALLLAVSPEARPRFDLTSALLLAFLGWNALSISTAIYRHDAWLEAARVFGALMVFFAIRALWTDRRAVWIASAWILGLTWTCFPALIDFAQTRYPRQAGPFFNTNLFANALAMTLPVALIFPALMARISHNRGVRILAFAPFVICALALVVTSSKGGFLAALIGLLGTGALIMRAKATQVGSFARQNRAILGAAGLLFVLLFGAIAAKTIVPRLQSARGAESNSTMFRAYIWRSTLEMARAKPLTGFGPGSFPHIYPRFAQVSYTRSAHQSWLQVASESGFPGLLLLLATIGAALKTGWVKLKTRDWPLVAGASGAVIALLVHGSVDSGFGTTSILILLAVALALLTASENQHASQAKSRLNLPWIGATLLLAGGGNQTQQAASGENARYEADQLLKNGAPSLALSKMREALEHDPTSARLWGNLGRFQEVSGEDGRAALQTAAALQPTRAANWSHLASAVANENPAQAEAFFARAVAQDPLDTRLRLQRAAFRLELKNSAGFADLEAVLALKNQPYGRYEPVEQNVNLDFARAAVMIAPELKRRGQNGRLQTLIASGLADCARARRFVAQNEQIRRETGGEFGNDLNNDLETVAAALQALQTPSP